MPQRARGSGNCGEAPNYELACGFIYSKTDNFEFIVVPYIMPLPWKVQRCNVIGTASGRERRLWKNQAQKIKRAGPSHKPHPKATCPHPTRPLRPAGSRARHDYAQVTLKMQPKLLVFFAFARRKFCCQNRITFRDRSHQFACGEIASILCNNTITRSSLPPALCTFKET